VFQRQTHSDPQIQVSISVHVFRCSPLRSSNSGGNFRSEHLPGPKFRSQNSGDNFKSSLSTSTQDTRIQVSKVRSHNPGSHNSDYHNSGLKFQVPILDPNFRSQFPILLFRVCLSVGRETTTSHLPRSLNSGPNFRTLN